ncbi:MAG: NADH-quinone oxidoreductase subunit L, partial [Xanthobacteraceae bacterium]
MYLAIVFLPLLGCVLAAAIAIVGARARCPGGDPAPGGEHAVHPADTHHAQPGTGHSSGHDGHSQEPAAMGTRSAEVITTALLLISMVFAWVSFVQVGLGGQDAHVIVANFFTVGSLKVEWALWINTLTAVMLVVVTTVSALVHLYSIGYMSEDPYCPRFFSYLSFFTFAMLMLVTADNLVQLFFGWEGVGLASYL